MLPRRRRPRRHLGDRSPDSKLGLPTVNLGDAVFIGRRALVPSGSLLTGPERTAVRPSAERGRSALDQGATWSPNRGGEPTGSYPRPGSASAAGSCERDEIPSLR